jgi:hypothetical protein
MIIVPGRTRKLRSVPKNKGEIKRMILVDMADAKHLMTASASLTCYYCGFTVVRDNQDENGMLTFEYCCIGKANENIAKYYQNCTQAVAACKKARLIYVKLAYYDIKCEIDDDA